jgi:hypothetical protein
MTIDDINVGDLVELRAEVVNKLSLRAQGAYKNKTLLVEVMFKGYAGSIYPGVLLGLPFNSGWEMTVSVMGFKSRNFDGSRIDVAGLVGAFKRNKLGYWWLDNNIIDKYILSISGHNQQLDNSVEDCGGLSLL